MRRLLLPLLALGGAAGVIVVVSLASRPDAARDRAADRAVPATEATEAPRPRPPDLPARPTLRILVRDTRDLPVPRARCDVEAWNASADTDGEGVALVPAPAGAPRDFSVRVRKEGYRPAARRGHSLEEGNEQAVEVRLLKAPEIRVFDEKGKRLEDVRWEPPGADLPERALHAPGHVGLDLREVPRDLLAAWDDLLASRPVDIFVLSDAGLACCVLRVDHPRREAAAVAVALAGADLPDLAPRLGTLPAAWRMFYASRWPLLRLSPRPVSGTIRAEPGQEIRVYAERTLVVHALAADCRPIRETIDVPPGETVERTLKLWPDPWASQEIVVTDRFGRKGAVEVALLDPLRLPLGAIEPPSSAVRVPRANGPWILRVDGGVRGQASLRVESLPSPEPLRFELKGIEVHLKLVDEESGEPVEALSLRVEGADGTTVRWDPEVGAYVFGPVDPGPVGLVHDPEHRVDLRVGPEEAEGGVLRREVRVRGFPKRVASDPE